VSQDSWQNPNEQPSGDAIPAPLPQYPSYPGGPYGYGAPAPLKPPMPNSVRIAVNLMFTGMAIGGLNMIIGIAELGAINDRMRALGYSDTTITADKGAFVAITVISGLIGMGLWLWMALATRGGHNYARIVSTVFFGLGVLGGLSNLANSWVPAIAKVSSVATLIVGLLAVVYVWRGESGPYFQRGYGGHQ
jgi:hypothetical protein